MFWSFVREEGGAGKFALRAPPVGGKVATTRVKESERDENKQRSEKVSR